MPSMDSTKLEHVSLQAIRGAAQQNVMPVPTEIRIVHSAGFGQKVDPWYGFLS